jgi:hypothetical protein
VFYRDVKIQPEVASRGEHSPSAARALLPYEVEQITAMAVGLPDSWVVCIEPPFGQMSISPGTERKIRHRCWVASPASRRIFRDNGLNHL